ncbi:hypothetical protein FRB99_001469 [Tulasnella sp. 403]|nr:hypothetical protein FRB99_001469 [Tulasnella sp. 403]
MLQAIFNYLRQRLTYGNTVSGLDAISGFAALPVEIVLEILFLSLEDQIDYYRALHERCQVCVWWNNIILSERRFWSLVVPWDDETQCMEQALQRSGNIPLFICTPTGNHSLGCSSKDLNRFVDLFRQYSHRCRTLVIDTWPLKCSDPFHGALHDLIRLGHLTSLQSFFIADEPLNFICPAKYLRGQAPTFRVIDISRGLFSTFSPLMTNLTSLKVDDCGALVKVGWLYQVLLSSPRLLYLDLSMEFTHDDLSTTLPHEIHLPFLEQVHLSFLPMRAGVVLLRAVEAPRCTTAAVHFALEEEIEELSSLLQSPSGGLLATISSALNDTKELSVHVGLHYIGARIGPNMGVGWALLSDDETTNSFRLPSQSSFPSVISAIITYQDARLAQWAIPLLASRLPSVEGLTLRGELHYNWTESLVPLSSPHEGGILWPGLHSLLVDGDCRCDIELSQLLSFLQFRVSLNIIQYNVYPKFRDLCIVGNASGLDIDMYYKLAELVDELNFVPYSEDSQPRLELTSDDQQGTSGTVDYWDGH